MIGPRDVADGRISDAFWVTDPHAVHVIGPVDQLNVIWRLAAGADDLFMPLVPDEQDVIVLGGHADGFPVDLGDQRARGVDRHQASGLGLRVHGRRHPVSREDDDGSFRYLVDLVDEDDAPFLKALHHVHVVHDLPTHVDRGSVLRQAGLDGIHRPFHAGAGAPRFGEQYSASER